MTKPKELEKYLTIGVVGYFSQPFDVSIASLKMQKLLYDAFIDKYPECVDLEDTTHREYPKVMLITGLTKGGMNSVVYDYVDHCNSGGNVNLLAGGVACEKAAEYDSHKVDWKLIVGKDWGDESASFVNACDILIRIGGGEQSMHEVQIARNLGKKVYESNLKTTPKES